LRFNNEVAWRGKLELSQNLQCQSVFTLNGKPSLNPAWERFEVYFPGSN
jgi:hypothetical protein